MIAAKFDPRHKERTREEEFCRFCRLVYDRHLVTGVGGNLSARIGDFIMLTPTGVSLRDVDPPGVVIVDNAGASVNGGTPTKDAGLHLRILEARPDINVVLHLHGTHIVAASTLLEPGPDTLPPLTPGFVFFAYPLPMLPFMVPGTEVLGETAAGALSRTGKMALMLKNHGLITLGRDFREAVNIAEEIDEAARIFLLTSGKGSVIPEAAVDKIA
jgi:ribulose-5-phosphate 4-epimerase/fuculose-1-phosphate aldolase